MNDKLKIFALTMKKKREELKKTQRGLAEEVGITAATISAYEKQIKFPSLENALAICEALDCTLDEMCGTVIEVNAEEIITYSDAYKRLIFVIDGLSGIITDVTAYDYTRPRSTIGIVFNDSHVLKFLSDWLKVRDLYRNGTIDLELYEAWQERKIREYDIKIKNINEVQNEFEELQADDDLPF